MLNNYHYYQYLMMIQSHPKILSISDTLPYGLWLSGLLEGEKIV